MMKKVKATICLVVAILFVAAGQGFGLIQYKDGQTHSINSTITTDVWVDYQSPGIQTTVNVLDGGDVVWPYQIQGHNDSIINISGGYVSQLGFFGNSRANISSGNIGYLWAHDNSQLTISGGTISSRLEIYESSKVIMSGGTIPPDSLTLVCTNAEWIISGSSFAIDGSPVEYGRISSILNSGWQSEPYRRITGILANGDLLNTQFKISNDTASIVLVPEPATLSLLAIGGMVLRMSRKRSRSI
jgi:hypothetical protein